MSRDHARSQKSSDDKKFWLHGQPPEGAKKDESAPKEEDKNAYVDSETDSEADWNEYQTYLRSKGKPLRHVGHADYHVVEHEAPHQDDRFAYRAWKEQHKHKMRKAHSHGRAHAHAVSRPYDEGYIMTSDPAVERDYQQYVDYKQQKWERKQERRREKEAFKQEKHWARFPHEGRYWTHVEHQRPAYETHVYEKPVYVEDPYYATAVHERVVRGPVIHRRRRSASRSASRGGSRSASRGGSRSASRGGRRGGSRSSRGSRGSRGGSRSQSGGRQVTRADRQHDVDFIAFRKMKYDEAQADRKRDIESR